MSQAQATKTPATVAAPTTEPKELEETAAERELRLVREQWQQPVPRDRLPVMVKCALELVGRRVTFTAEVQASSTYRSGRCVNIHDLEYDGQRDPAWPSDIETSERRQWKYENFYRVVLNFVGKPLPSHIKVG